MTTDYDSIAKEYQACKFQPWREHVEAYSFFMLTGDVSEKYVLDLACGEGFYTRQLKLRGAAHVEGVDMSVEMIRLARESEEQIPLGVTYHKQNVLQLKLNKKFDLITASYLLNYARNSKELFQFGKVIAEHLNPGGRFVTINSNPEYIFPVDAMLKYGFTRENKSHSEGGEIIYRFYQGDGSHIEVINYHLAKKTHEIALKQAGLSNIEWHPVELCPSAIDGYAEDFWKAIIQSQPITGLTSMKVET